MTMPNDFKFDSRIRQRMLRRGDLSSTELQAHLERLPDLNDEYEDMNEFTQPALVPARADACEPSPAFDPRRLGGISNAAASSSYLPSKSSAQAARPAPRPLSPLIPSPSAAERARPAPAFSSALDDVRRAQPVPVVTRVAPAAVEAALGADGIPAAVLPERRIPGEPGSESEPHTPVTLRSETANAKPGALDDEDEDDEDDDDDDLDDDDEDDDDVDDIEGEEEGLESDDDDEDDEDDDELEGGDDDEEPPTNPRGAQ
jgi:hypothetical protein